MLNEKIKQRRKELNMTQEELAQKTGYKTKGAISRIEKGERDLSQSQISDFARALKTTESYLMGWKEEKIDLSKIKGITLLNKARKIPILGTIACGTPIWAEENFDGFFIADYSIKADFALKCQGDSMIDAGVNDGDLVFLKKTPNVENGKIGAILIDNEATLKKVIKTDNALILQPCNSEYQPIVLTNNEEVMILGEMVGVYQVRSN